MRASLADDFVCELPSEVVLNRFFLRCSFDSGLETVHEHREVLLDVHLLKDVYWLTLPVFKRVAV